LIRSSRRDVAMMIRIICAMSPLFCTMKLSSLEALCARERQTQLAPGPPPATCTSATPRPAWKDRAAG
jgi:hypothetical protein